MSNDIVLACQGIQKKYTEGPQQLEVLADVNLQVRAGERVAIVGASGSGKTTLLNMLGGLDTPSKGVVTVEGSELSSLSEVERGYLRNKKLGFVYQLHHLLDEFTALENVAMPLLIGGFKPAKASQWATEMLDEVGLAQRLQHKPAELSGGERQRVAIARALVTRPACVLMDEPTGNLDPVTAQSIQDLMVKLNKSLQTCFVIVTHDHQFAERMDRTLELHAGKLRPLEKSIKRDL
jgi:lipoprotein-releasing system ATP-binding protein